MEASQIISQTKEKMNLAIEHLNNELSKLRTGKASSKMVEDVSINYYGTPTPLSQISNISTIDARTIQIQPWEKAMIVEIEKGIQLSELGMQPVNKGEVVLINVPILTEERRKDIVKQCKAEIEIAKVSVRNIRRDSNDKIKNLEKNGEISKDETKILENENQEVTDEFIKNIEIIYKNKEKDLLNI